MSFDAQGISWIIGNLVGKIAKQGSWLYTKFVPLLIIVVMYVKTFLTGLGIPDPEPGETTTTIHIAGLIEYEHASWGGMGMLGGYAKAAFFQSLRESAMAVFAHTLFKNTKQGVDDVYRHRASIRGPKEKGRRR